MEKIMKKQFKTFIAAVAIAAVGLSAEAMVAVPSVSEAFPVTASVSERVASLKDRFVAWAMANKALAICSVSAAAAVTTYATVGAVQAYKADKGEGLKKFFRPTNTIDAFKWTFNIKDETPAAGDTPAPVAAPATPADIPVTGATPAATAPVADPEAPAATPAAGNVTGATPAATAPVADPAAPVAAGNGVGVVGEGLAFLAGILNALS